MKIFKLNRLLKTAIAFLLVIILGFLSLLAINCHIKSKMRNNILSLEEASVLTDVDCIMVLGCGVYDDVPGKTLNNRLTVGIQLYFNGASQKLLMTGDHGRSDYDEVNVMKQVAIDANVPSEDVFMDHAGFSTYESVYRAKEIFGVDKMIIVTQEYHLYRALFIAEQFDIEAYGVSADLHQYGSNLMRETREFLARGKDFFTSIFKPKPTYLGEQIPVSGNGNVTND